MSFLNYLQAIAKSAVNEKNILGFRNVLIHDYLDFDRDIIIRIIKNRDYIFVYNFLIQEINYSSLLIKRVENFKY